MLSCGVDYVPESYKAYKNRVYTKHMDKIKNQIMQIRQCSLHGDDKKKLLQQLETELQMNQ